jgi:hypothetical protein
MRAPALRDAGRRINVSKGMRDCARLSGFEFPNLLERLIEHEPRCGIDAHPALCRVRSTPDGGHQFALSLQESSQIARLALPEGSNRFG